MYFDVIDVKPISSHGLHVQFKDGLKGKVIFLPSFFRGVFSPLKDKNQFNKVHLIDGVVTWEGELDLAPDAMHESIKKHGEWILD